MTELAYSRIGETPDDKTKSDSQLIWFCAFFGIFVLSGFSNYLFASSFGFMVEIPLFICFLYSIHAFSVKIRIFNRCVTFSLIFLFILLPFALVSFTRGIPFFGVYSDVRSMYALFIFTFILTKVNSDKAKLFIYYSSFFAIAGTATYYFLDSSGVISGSLSQAKVAGKQFTPVYYMFPMILVSLNYKSSKLVFISLMLCLYMLLFVAFRQVFILTAAAALSYIFVLTRRVSGKAISSIIYSIFGFIFITILVSGVVSKERVTDLLYGISDAMEAVGVPYDYQYQLVLKTAATLNGVFRSKGDQIYYLFSTNIFNFERFLIPHGIGQKYSIGDPVIWGGNSLDNSLIFFNYHFSIFVMLILLAAYISFFVYNLFRQEFVNVPVFLACFSAFSLFVYFRAYVFLDVSIAISFAFFLTAVAISSRSKRSGSPVRGSSI